MVNKISCILTVVILFLFFVGTSLNFESVNAQNSNVDLIIQGASLVDHGMSNEAILIFDEILSKDPKHVGALIGKSMALKNMLKFEEAKNILDVVLKLEPDNLDAQIQRLDVLKYLKDHDEIRSSLVEILGPNLTKLPYFENTGCWTCFGVVPFLNPMRDTDDYIGSVQFKMRDSDDNLVGVIESDLLHYPTHPIFDNSLSNYPVLRTLEKDGNVYEMRKIIVTYTVNMEEHDIFLNKLVAHGEIGEIKLIFLAAVNMGIAVEEGDHFVAEFEIGKKI